jgi:hypothetical protein
MTSPASEPQKYSEKETIEVKRFLACLAKQLGEHRDHTPTIDADGNYSVIQKPVVHATPLNFSPPAAPIVDPIVELKMNEDCPVIETIDHQNNFVRRKQRRADGSGVAEIISADGSRACSEWDGLGNNSLTKYDCDGKVIEQSKQTQKGYLQDSKWNEQGDRKTSTFDTTGRKVSDEIVHVNGSGVLHRYETDGSYIKKIYDWNGNVSTTTCDSLGRITANDYRYSDGARRIERFDSNGVCERMDFNANGERRVVTADKIAAPRNLLAR